jgi:hypothetical protein
VQNEVHVLSDGNVSFRRQNKPINKQVSKSVMSNAIQVGTAVKWKWGEGWGRGKVTERLTEDVTKTISGSEISRNASDDEPAYLIEQEDGQQVLKSVTEIERDD